MTPLLHRLYRAAHPVWRVAHRARHGLTVGVRVIALDSHGRIGLVRHTYVAGWHLPGGGVDAGETVADAARREVREELHARLIGPLRCCGVYDNHASMPRDHIVLFEAAAEAGAGWTRPPDREIAEAGWFALDALPDEISPATQARLAERAGAPRAEVWRAETGASQASSD